MVGLHDHRTQSAAIRGRRRVLHVAFIVPALWLLFGPLAQLRGQATSGSITGRVTDPTQAAAPDVGIRVQHRPTGLTQSTQTNHEGEYSLTGLPPGTYTLTAEKSGFGAYSRGDLQLSIDQKMRVDVELRLGVLSQTERVGAEDPPLQVQSAETGEVIQSREILDLPLLGRNFLELARLAAGATKGAGGNTLNVAVNGQREFANSVLVDGVEATANRNNDTTLRPSVDAVQEFKVLTSAYNAEFGRASGAVIAIQTQSGGNGFHGSLYEFYRPGAVAARSFFSSESSQLKQHNYGATLGGPARKDKTFFFGSFERVRLRNSFDFLDSVPPSDQIRYLANGGVDLAGLRDPLTGKQVPIFDPNATAADYWASPFP